MTTYDNMTDAIQAALQCCNDALCNCCCGPPPPIPSLYQWDALVELEWNNLTAAEWAIMFEEVMMYTTAKKASQIKVSVPEITFVIYPLKDEVGTLETNIEQSYNLVGYSSNKDVMIGSSISPKIQDNDKIIFQMEDSWIGILFGESEGFNRYDHPKKIPYAIRSKKKDGKSELIFIMKQGKYQDIDKQKLLDYQEQDQYYSRFIQVI